MAISSRKLLELLRASAARESRALNLAQRAVARQYRTAAFDRVADELRKALAEPNARKRQTRLRALLHLFDEATRTLGAPPAVMRRLIREGVRGRVLTVDEMLRLSDPALSFNDPTELAARAVTRSRQRMNDYWANEQKRFRDDVAKTTRDVLRRGLDEDQAVRLLMERTNVSRSRATLIVQDSMLTAFAEADRRRQLDAGVREYLWRTRGDNRVRTKHATLNGKRRAWRDGNLYPGSEIRCRCRAVPVVRT